MNHRLIKCLPGKGEVSPGSRRREKITAGMDLVCRGLFFFSSAGMGRNHRFRAGIVQSLVLAAVLYVGLGGFAASALAEPPAQAAPSSAAPSSAGSSNEDLSIAPRVVDIGAFYNGEILRVSGKIPAGSDVVLRFMGPPQEMHLKRKGKAFGVLWMNMGSLTFSNVPNVCLVYANRDLDQLAGTNGENSAVKTLGFEGLAPQVVITPAPEAAGRIFQELLTLKKKSGLFSENFDSVQYRNATGEFLSFEAEINLPSRIQPGEYQLEKYVTREGQIISRESRPVTVKMVGFPLIIANLAFHHGALFGVLASVTAILGGLIVSLFFKGGKGGH